MTISKTKAHKQFLLGAIFALKSIFPSAAYAEVANRFECLKEILPLTDKGAKADRTRGTEPPFFLLDHKYLAFAETRAGRVSGFYIYDHDHAWYYDAVEASPYYARRTGLKDLRAERRTGILELTAQPNGLETIAIAHLPGFGSFNVATQATAILGASVLPVVGAFIPNPPAKARVYHDPTRAPEREVESWFKRRESASVVTGAPGVARTILRLATEHAKTPAELWAPLVSELESRRAWIRQNNIDQPTFRRFNRVLQTTCHE